MLLLSSAKHIMRRMICIATLLLGAQWCAADTFLGPAGEEDTILIEEEARATTKIPYHLILKKISKRMFQFDSESLVTFGKGRSDHIVRSFSDLADRCKTRFNVDRDEVEVKLSLNF